MKKLFLALCVCAGLCACSDDVIEGTSSSIANFDGDEIYMTVSIKDVNSATRAAWDNNYAAGSTAEQTVTNAYFYFYDEDGLFVSRAEVWDGGEAVSPTEQNNYVEFDGNTVIVLKGLTEVGFPKYMVTVLNEPQGFEDAIASQYEPAATLDALQTHLAAQDYVGIYDESDTEGNFVMSTSSYQAQDESTRPYYFVTEIPESAFHSEPIPTDLTDVEAVDVYVERLAAKVQLTTSLEPTENGRYLIKETVGGDENEEDDQDPDDVEAGDGEGAQDIYIEFLGWALNATARQSYMLKNIESTSVWTNTGETDLGTGWTWNDYTNFRSYWGMSYNYGIDADYPTSSNGNTDTDEESSDTWLNEYLKYTSLEDGNLTQLGSNYSNYCAENTNTAGGEDGILQSPYSSGITHVLLKAQAFADATTTDPLELVRYRGELYTVDGFWNYVNERIGDHVDLYSTMYFSTVDYDGTTEVDPDNMTPISQGDFLYVVNQGDGVVYVELNSDAMTESGYYWYYLRDGEYYQLRTDTDLPTIIADIDSSLDSEINTYAINWFTDGLMYYAIPIEHFNNTDYATLNETTHAYDYDLHEANFGVVRNHWYVLDITALSNLGKGIYDESEVIIPDPEDEVYLYVAANIHILSWKMVNQSVEL